MAVVDGGRAADLPETRGYRLKRALLGPAARHRAVGAANG